MPDRKIDDSAVLAQIRADEGVAGSRARKEAQREASRDQARAGRVNRKGVPRREVPVNGEHRGYAVGPAPAPVVEAEPAPEAEAVPARKPRVRRCSPNIPNPPQQVTPKPVQAPELELEDPDSKQKGKKKKRLGKQGLRLTNLSGLSIGSALGGGAGGAKKPGLRA